jgi:serine/threonine protein kinase/WD40 repeat protein
MTSPNSGEWNRAEEILDAIEGMSREGAREYLENLRARGESEVVLRLVERWRGLPPPPPPLGAGDVIAGRYELKTMLGEGGMGVVWRARQKMIERDVAVKIIPPALVAPALRGRFAKEMAILGQLQHPGIVRIFDAGLHVYRGADIPFFAMELVEGEPLEEWASARRQDRGNLLRTMSEVCAALQHAHDRKVVHRDLKPSNIMVRGNGQPVVLDFGIARLSGGGEEGPEEFSGTPHYAAPEQHLGRDRDFRSGESVDVYAMGAVVFEVLTGRRLISFSERKSMAEIRGAIVEGKVPRLREAWPECPPLLDEVVARAVRRDPADRFYSIVAMSRALRRVASSLDGPSKAELPPWVPAPGAVIPGTDWKLTEKIGEGGVGQVWMGEHAQLGQKQVFKFCDSEEKIRTLKRELTLFRLLKERVGQNPHFIRIHEVSLEEPPWYLMMDHVAAEDLKAWCQLQPGGLTGLSLEVRVGIIAQVAEALQVAHEAGILHRDIKPGNILVSTAQTQSAGSSAFSGEPHVYIADFGIGQIIAEELLRGDTRLGFTRTILELRSGTISGTIAYMAPEVMAGGTATARSDIWSLGVVLWQILIGDFGIAANLTSWASRISDPLLRQDLEQCFADSPDERWSSAGALAASLRALPERRMAEAKRLAEIAARERAAYRRGVVRTAAVAVAVILALAGAGWYAFDRSEAARFALADAYVRGQSQANSELKKLAMDPGANRNAAAVEVIRRTPPRTDEEKRALAENYVPILEGDDWQMNTRRLSGRAHKAVFDSTGQFVIRQMTDGNIELWDLANAKSLWNRPGFTDVGIMVISAGGKRVALAKEKEVSIVDGATGVVEREVAFESPVTSMAWRGDGLQLAVGWARENGEGVIDLCDQPDWKASKQLFRTGSNPVALRPTGLAYSPDGAMLAHWSSESLHLLLWDVAAGGLAAFAYHPDHVQTALWAANSSSSLPGIYSAAGDAFIYGWALEKRNGGPAAIDVRAVRFPVRGLERQGHYCEWHQLAMLESGQFLMAADQLGSVVCFDVSSGQVAAEIAGRDRILALGSNDTGVVLCTEGGELRDFRRVRSPATRLRHSRHTGPIEDFDVSPDGHSVACAGPRGVVVFQGEAERIAKAIDPRTRKLEPLLIARCRGLRFMDDMRLICSDSAHDRTLRIEGDWLQSEQAPRGKIFLPMAPLQHGRPARVALNAERNIVVSGRAESVAWGPLGEDGIDIPCAEKAAPQKVAISTSGSIIAWSDTSSEAWACLSRGAPPIRLAVSGATAVSIVGDRWLIVGGNSGIRVFSLPALVETPIAGFRPSSVVELTSQQKGLWTAVVTNEGGIVLGKLEDGEQPRWKALAHLGSMQKQIFSGIRFVGNDRWLGAATTDGKLRLWDVAALIRSLDAVSCLPGEFVVPLDR